MYLAEQIFVVAVAEFTRLLLHRWRAPHFRATPKELLIFYTTPRGLLIPAPHLESSSFPHRPLRARCIAPTVESSLCCTVLRLLKMSVTSASENERKLDEWYQNLCRKLSGILFPLTKDGELDLGTPADPIILHEPIIKAFGNATAGLDSPTRRSALTVPF
jgi:hypothetical protein